MGPRTRGEYLSLRQIYLPRNPRLVILAESPPTSGLYFYDQNGSVAEPLFGALMRQLSAAVSTKGMGLGKFRDQGWLLVDATYEPVDKLTPSQRDKVIERDYPALRQDLRGLLDDRPIPIVIVKANVCRALDGKLTADGFHVLNRGEIVCFPSNGWQTVFHRQFGNLMAAAELL